ncbi:MAG: SRPBCC family protein [Elusimicrobia bacterium]|nr:SRPBCC family protein [Elusimicrobiota bacterium]
MAETGTVRMHRVVKAPPARAFKAFSDPEALAKWLPPYGFICTVHSFDFKVGGGHKMSFRNFTTGHGHSFGGKYLEIVPNEKLVYTDKFDDPNLPGEMKVTVTFKKVLCGTEVSVVQEGIPSVIPTEMCYLGWQESIEQYAKLVDPEIPD